MRKRKILQSAALYFMLIILLFPPLVEADFLIKSIKQSDEGTMKGETPPSQDELGQTWIDKNKFRQDRGENSKIIRLDLKKIYIIDHSQKTYSEIDLPVDLEKLLPLEVQQILQMTQIEANVTDSGEIQIINNWNCKKFLVEISVSVMGMSGALNIEIWTSEDLRIDLDDYYRFYMETLLLNPLFKDIAEEFQKLEGYPVRTRFSMTMMETEIKYQEEVISVERKSAPSGTYDLPQGYTKTAYNPLPWLR